MVRYLINGVGEVEFADGTTPGQAADLMRDPANQQIVTEAYGLNPEFWQSWSTPTPDQPTEPSTLPPSKPVDQQTADDRWEITKGLAAGVDALGAIGSGLVAAAGDALENEDLQQWGINKLKEFQAEQAQSVGENPTIESVLEDDDKLDAFVNWAAYNMGSGAATSIPILLASLVPGVGPALAVGAAYGMGVGDVYGSQLKESEDPNVAISAALGIPYAVAERVFGVGSKVGKRLADKLWKKNVQETVEKGFKESAKKGFKESAKKGFKESAKNVSKRITKDMGSEAVAEGLQTGITTTGEILEGEDRSFDEMLTKDFWKEVGEASAAGAVGGMGISSLGVTAEKIIESGLKDTVVTQDSLEENDAKAGFGVRYKGNENAYYLGKVKGKDAAAIHVKNEDGTSSLELIPFSDVEFTTTEPIFTPKEKKTEDILPTEQEAEAEVTPEEVAEGGMPKVTEEDVVEAGIATKTTEDDLRAMGKKDLFNFMDTLGYRPMDRKFRATGEALDRAIDKTPKEELLDEAIWALNKATKEQTQTPEQAAQEQAEAQALFTPEEQQAIDTERREFFEDTNPESPTPAFREEFSDDAAQLWLDRNPELLDIEDARQDMFNKLVKPLQKQEQQTAPQKASEADLEAARGPEWKQRKAELREMENRFSNSFNLEEARQTNNRDEALAALPSSERRRYNKLRRSLGLPAVTGRGWLTHKFDGTNKLTKQEYDESSLKFARGDLPPSNTDPNFGLEGTLPDDVNVQESVSITEEEFDIIRDKLKSELARMAGVDAVFDGDNPNNRPDMVKSERKILFYLSDVINNVAKGWEAQQGLGMYRPMKGKNFTEESQQRLGVLPDTVIHAIELAYNKSPDLFNTISHETIHLLREAGAFTNQEWATLSQAARTSWIDKYDIRNLYEGESESVMIEEAIAFAFADYYSGKIKPSKKVQSIFNKLYVFIEDFHKNINKFLGRNPDVKEIFDKVMDGRIGRRDIDLVAKANAPTAAGFPSSSSFDRWFGKSVVSKRFEFAPNDVVYVPKFVYHGTGNMWQDQTAPYRPGTHFGTFEQAFERAAINGDQFVPLKTTPQQLTDAIINITKEFDTNSVEFTEEQMSILVAAIDKMNSEGTINDLVKKGDAEGFVQNIIEFFDFQTNQGAMDFKYKLDTLMQNAGIKYTTEGFEGTTGPHIRPTFLSIQNPIRLRDEGFWGVDEIGAQLLELGIINETQFKTMKKHENDAVSKLTDLAEFEQKSTEVVIDWLRMKGYDGIVYENTQELGPSGASDSYIIFSPDQVRTTMDPGNYEIPVDNVINQNSYPNTPGALEQHKPTLTKTQKRVLFQRARADVKALTKAEGGIPKDRMSALSATVLTPGKLAESDPLIGKLWTAVMNFKEQKAAMQNKYLSKLAPYTKLSAQQKLNFRRAAEISQMREGRFVPNAEGNLVFVAPTDGKGKNSDVKAGDVITLTGKEVEAYVGMQEALKGHNREQLKGLLFNQFDTLDPTPEERARSGMGFVNLLDGYKHFLQPGMDIDTEFKQMMEAIENDNFDQLIKYATRLYHDIARANPLSTEAIKLIDPLGTQDPKAIKEMLKADMDKADLKRARQLQNLQDEAANLLHSFKVYKRHMSKDYFPQSRYGNAFMTITNGKGKTVYYEQFENKSDKIPFLGQRRSNRKFDEKEEQLNQIIADLRQERVQLQGELDTEGGKLEALREQNKRMAKNDPQKQAMREAIKRQGKKVAQIKKRVSELADLKGKVGFASFDELKNVYGHDIAVGMDVASSLLSGNSSLDYNEMVNKVKREVRARGFAAHFAPRKGIAGYDTDFARSVGDYIMMGSHTISMARNMPAMSRINAQIQDEAVQDPERAKFAREWLDYIISPANEFAGLRMMGFYWYLGGNPSSAILQGFSVPQYAATYLGSYVGFGKAAKTFTKGFYDMTKLGKLGGPAEGHIDVWLELNNLPEDVKAEAIYAYEQGVLKQGMNIEEFNLNTHDMKSFSAAGKVKTFFTQQVLSSMFSTVEAGSRTWAFISALRLARENPQMIERFHEGHKNDQRYVSRLADRKMNRPDPYFIAEWTVERAFGVYGKENRAKWMRGVGAPLLQFQNYPLMMFEFLHSLAKKQGKYGRRALASALAMLFISGGVLGLPGGDDIEELLNFFYSRYTGGREDISQILREAFMETEGGNKHIIADFMEHGLFRLAGVDVGRRISLGQLPGSSFAFGLAKALGGEVDLRSAGGVPGSLIFGNATNISKLMSQSRGEEALQYIMPTFAGNLYKALYIHPNYGLRSISSGKILMQPEEFHMDSGFDMDKFTMRGLQGMGFSPSKVAEARTVEYKRGMDKTKYQNLKQKFTKRLEEAYLAEMNAMKRDDRKALQEAREELLNIHTELRQVNARLPISKYIRIDLTNVLNKVIMNRLHPGMRDYKDFGIRGREIEKLYTDD